MAEPIFKTVAKTSTTPVDNRARKVVLTNTEPLCWLEDYEEEVSVTATGEYYNRYKQDGTLIRGRDSTNYKLYLPTKSKKPVLIEVRFYLESMLSVKEEKDIFEKIRKTKLAEIYGGDRGFLLGIKDTCEKGVNDMLQGKLSVKITDSKCEPRTCPITYKIVWVDQIELAHYILRVYSEVKRESVHGNIVSVGIMTKSRTYAHEFLHCIGIPDEYAYSATAYETVRYVQPDEKLSKPILCAPVDPTIPDPEESLSLMNSADHLEPRHGYPVALEIKKILHKATGRNVICEVSRA